ncbi:transposase [Chromatocurvus halotolerans]|uniref:Transposase n=2 Tax=Chromatocurvus halotolerans TaxID=1132028 RepID=A0A4R2KJ80_9GAMM|nr:transposase [Chromatocurvus halotolerans]
MAEAEAEADRAVYADGKFMRAMFWKLWALVFAGPVLLGVESSAQTSYRRSTDEYVKWVEPLHASPLHALAKTLTSWLEPIAAMWRFSKSNGVTEGYHTKMEMMTRRAYGFRNFENYRLRVLTHCGWDGIINRV